MAGVTFVTNTTAETICLGTSAHTLIRLIPPSSHIIKIKEWGIFFDGISVTAEPVLITIATCTTAVTGNYTANVPLKRSGPPIVSQCLAQTMNTSSEPAIVGLLAVREVHPQSGYQEKFSFGDEIVCTGPIFLQVTAPTSVNAIAEMCYEE